MTTITFGELSFKLQESDRRRTIGITIERDGTLILTTPPAVPTAELEKIVNEKRYWIHKKLLEKEALKPPRGIKEYISGEGFYYLGYSYRLKLKNHPFGTFPLRLYQGYFELLHSEKHRGEDLFTQWYRRHLQPYVTKMVNSLVNRVGIKPRAIQVRELGYHWGSCNPQGDLYFHWRVAMLPRPMIEYVVVHEMVHLLEPNHNYKFWERVERILPDYKERKQWLAENGAIYTL